MAFKEDTAAANEGTFDGARSSCCELLLVLLVLLLRVVCSDCSGDSA